MMGRFLFLRNTVNTPAGIAMPPSDHVIDVLDQYDLERLALDGYDGLLLSMHADQRHLEEMRPWLDAFLDRGRTIAVNGQVVRRFADGLSLYEPRPGRTRADLEIQITALHPILRGVAETDLTFRKSVAGFWGRGRVPPPRGASILSTVGDPDWPVDWVWQRPSGGWLFMHAGNDVWGYAQDDSTAARVFPQLLDWIACP
jgi:hypothetical protein